MFFFYYKQLAMALSFSYGAKIFHVGSVPKTIHFHDKRDRIVTHGWLQTKELLNG